MIAIIDDDASIRAGIESFIESHGFPAQSFASAENFLHTANFDLLDCVVTDINMRGMSGVDLQKIIKASHSRIPVIVMTALSNRVLRENVMASGAEGFFIKPFQITDLMRQIEIALHKAN